MKKIKDKKERLGLYEKARYLFPGRSDIIALTSKEKEVSDEDFIKIEASIKKYKKVIDVEVAETKSKMDDWLKETKKKFVSIE